MLVTERRHIDGHISVQMAMTEQQQQQQQLLKNPSIAIIEEPMQRVRFRYATEGEKAGNIYGINSNNLKQTFPTVVVSFVIYLFTIIGDSHLHSC